MDLTTGDKIIVVSSIISIIAAIKIKKRKREQRNNLKKNRSLWSPEWLPRRDSGLDFASMAMDELRLVDPKAFKNFARMSFTSFSELLGKVSPLIYKQNTVMRDAISGTARLLLTLRFLATGEKYTQLAHVFRISQAAISVVIPETIDAIYSVLKDDFLKAPRNANEWKSIADDFELKWNFPFCLGAIDGTHIAIKSKIDYGSLYYNYKGFHSVILLAIVDANYNFIYVNVGSNGGTNDAAVFNESSLGKAVTKNLFDFPADDYLPGTNKKVPCVFVADAAFRLTSRILKPYGERSANANKIFNYRLSRARRVAENAFGILANKFQIFQKEIPLSIEKVEKLTLASCALHNFISKRDGFDEKLLDSENTKSVNFQKGSWRNEVSMTDLQRCQSNRSGDEGRKVRDTLSEYFNTVGSVPWQNDAVKKFNF